jgi:hypothetical protein
MVRDTQAAITQAMAEARRTLDEDGLTEMALQLENAACKRGSASWKLPGPVLRALLAHCGRPCCCPRAVRIG